MCLIGEKNEIDVIYMGKRNFYSERFSTCKKIENEIPMVNCCIMFKKKT